MYVKFNVKQMLAARDSGKFETHRDYVKALFKFYHKVDIIPEAFSKLKFHYTKRGVTMVEAPKGSYIASRDTFQK